MTVETEVLFGAANIGIALGYVFICLVVVPSFPVQLTQTKVGGALFFLTCGLTHAHLAWHTFAGPPGIAPQHLLSPWNVVVHTVQVVAVWLFIWGLYQEFVKPDLNKQRRRT